MTRQVGYIFPLDPVHLVENKHTFSMYTSVEMIKYLTIKIHKATVINISFIVYIYGTYNSDLNVVVSAFVFQFSCTELDVSLLGPFCLQSISPVPLSFLHKRENILSNLLFAISWLSSLSLDLSLLLTVYLILPHPINQSKCIKHVKSHGMVDLQSMFWCSVGCTENGERWWCEKVLNQNVVIFSCCVLIVGLYCRPYIYRI